MIVGMSIVPDTELAILYRTPEDAQERKNNWTMAPVYGAKVMVVRGPDVVMAEVTNPISKTIAWLNVNDWKEAPRSSR